MTTPTHDSTTPHTVEGLLRVVEDRDAEVVLLKLMVDELKLLRSARARFGAPSEQFDDPQIALLEGAPLYEQPAPMAAAAPDAANAPQIDRKLPSHVPRETRSIDPRSLPITMTPTASLAAAPPAAAAFALSARTSPSN